ncbi:MAG: glycosyltransferase family 2 protein [Lautropia sp.]|nr:glycosyltransferase family 2 protein [Lautropia sp.]
MDKRPTSATVAGIRQVAAARSTQHAAANDADGGEPPAAAATVALPNRNTSGRASCARDDGGSRAEGHGNTDNTGSTDTTASDAAGHAAPALSTPSAAGITAVVVTYHPNIERLAELLRLTRPQVSHVEVIDNGSPPACVQAIHALCDDTIRLHPQGRNLGIGGAQNAGIAIARQHGADYVLLLDHDSLPAPDMVARLRSAIEAQPAGSQSVAAAGPYHADPRHPNAPSPFVRQQGMKRVACECKHENQLMEVEHVIASGCLIPLAVLDRVGDMNTQLFIDYVDIEWCLRATHAGFRILGVCGARLSHELGDDFIQFRGKTLSNHSPLRNYYLFRNGLLLSRMPHIPPAWKRMDLRNLLIRFIINAVAQRPRWPWVRMSLLGILDGLRGKTGPRQADKA